MNRQYKDMLDELHFSQEHKARMVESLLSAKDEKIASRRHRPIRHMIAAGIAAAVVLSMGAGAAYTGLASDAFANVFGTAHTEIIDKIGRPVGVSDSDHGVTITADAILGDHHNLNIVFTLIKDDGSAWDMDGRTLIFDQSDLWLKHEGGAHGASWFIDDTSGDNRIQYMMQTTIDEDSGIPMGTAKAQFENLYILDGTTGERELLIPGKWTLRFDVQYEDSSVSLLTQPIKVQTAAGKAVIDEVSLSAVGYRVGGHYEAFNTETQQLIAQELQGSQPSGREPQDSAFGRMRDISIVMNRKDGAVVDLNNGGGSGNLAEGTFTMSGCYTALYDLDDIQSVTVQGVTIPVPTNE